MVGTVACMSNPYKPRDAYYKKAKRAGLRARSAFKLEEAARRFGLLRRGTNVLDLGAAPGGFLQVVSRELGPKGSVLGIDIVPIRPLASPGGAPVRTEVLDVHAEDFLEQLQALEPRPFDTVLSDMAPKTSGIRDRDEARSIALAERALDVAILRGRPGSGFLVKIFMGRDFEGYRDRVRAAYTQVKVVRPEATRDRSIEVYLVGLGLKEVEQP